MYGDTNIDLLDIKTKGLIIYFFDGKFLSWVHFSVKSTTLPRPDDSGHWQPAATSNNSSLAAVC